MISHQYLIMDNCWWWWCGTVDTRDAHRPWDTHKSKEKGNFKIGGIWGTFCHHSLILFWNNVRLIRQLHFDFKKKEKRKFLGRFLRLLHLVRLYRARSPVGSCHPYSAILLFRSCSRRVKKKGSSPQQPIDIRWIKSRCVNEIDERTGATWIRLHLYVSVGPSSNNNTYKCRGQIWRPIKLILNLKLILFPSR